MKKITKEELDVFLRKHKLWLCDEPDGERANLGGADLRGADLWRANLRGADLRGADLGGAKGIPPIACPEEGSFIAFKKARDNLIVKLLIPEDARRCSATSRKCRCDKAIVLSITKRDGSESGITSAASKYDDKFIYTVGKTVCVDNFCEDRWEECSAGIHFFITREEAEGY